MGNPRYRDGFRLTLNEGNRTEYFLFFTTNSLDGLSKMKQAMWRADPVRGQAFSDRTDPRQGVLLGPQMEQLEDLRRLLLGRAAMGPLAARCPKLVPQTGAGGNLVRDGRVSRSESATFAEADVPVIPGVA